MVLRHVRVRVGGQLYADASWSVGLAMSPAPGIFIAEGEISSGELDAYADAARQAFQGLPLPADILQLLSTSGQVDFLRTSVVGPDGREEAVSLIEFTDDIRGTRSAALPAQAAVTASLRTGRPGGSYRGRLYWPALAVSLTAGRISTADQTIALNGTRAWLRGLNAIPASTLGGIDLAPVVVSGVRTTNTPITSVAVGNRLDSQRRRSESQEESYAVATLA